MSRSTLLVLQGTDQGARFALDEPPVTLGRGVRNDIRILDTEVSRQHAQIDVDGERAVLVDRGSSNGTFVNGAEVREHVLFDGDQVQIGRTVLLFQDGAASDESARIALDHVDFVGADRGDDRSNIVVRLSPDPSVVGETLAPAKDVAHTVEDLQALYRVAEELVTPSVSLEQLLRRVIDRCIEVVGADRGCLLLTDPTTGELAPHVYGQRADDDRPGRMTISRSIVDYVAEQGEGVRTTDARHDERFDTGQSVLRAGIREVICVPMQGRYELMGVLYVDSTTTRLPEVDATEPAGRFDDAHLRLVLAIGRQCALAVENDRYQRAFVKAERLAAVGQTIAMLSHHIKNILQGVRGGSYLIDMGLGKHDEDLVRRGWGIVEKNQNRIYHLVMDMLTFSTERKPALERSSLNDTVADVVELMQSRAAEHDVKLEYDPDESLVETVFDPEGIHRAVLNIVTNAIDAVEGREEGVVLLRTGSDDMHREVFVEVLDNGAGIPEDQIRQIFQAFESSKGARGTGLGLAVSLKILREHGGDITVESEVGHGSRFLLNWPIIEDDARSGDSRTRI